MISPLDDFPVHQVPEPIAHVGTSDRDFSERYYFNAHACSGDVFVIVGLGQYPNRGVTDAFAVVMHDGVQRVVRASRRLGDRSDTSVGPVSIDVVEGIRRFRVSCSSNESGVEFDLSWQSTIRPSEEPTTRERRGARLAVDTKRFVQTGRWTGHVMVDGRVFDVSPDRWWGGRDHSWGIRPIGAAPPDLPPDGVAAGHFKLWTPMQFEPFSVTCFAYDDAAGRRMSEAAFAVPSFDGDGDRAALGRVRHSLVFRPGTHLLAGGSFEFPDTASPPLRRVTIEPLTSIFLDVGTGYGERSGWRHGKYQGDMVVQARSWTRAECERMSDIEACLCRFMCDDGLTGYGVLDIAVKGTYAPYGITAISGVGKR